MRASKRLATVKRAIPRALVVCLALLIPALTDVAWGSDPWGDGFEAYDANSQLHGQGGWRGWDNNSGAGALVNAATVHAGSRSVAITDDSDMVHCYSGANSGHWTFTAWQYVPGNYNGCQYFILLNTYADNGPYNWSTQLYFDSNAGIVHSDDDAHQLPLATGRWVQIRVAIDLDADVQSIFYDGHLLCTKSWTDGVSGDGAVNIAAVDLYANGASPIYYDDLALEPRRTLQTPTISPNGGTLTAPQAVDIAAHSLTVWDESTPGWAVEFKYPSLSPPIESVAAWSGDGTNTLALHAHTDTDDWYQFAGVNMRRSDGAAFPFYFWSVTGSCGTTSYPPDIFAGHMDASWSATESDPYYGEAGNRVYVVFFEDTQGSGLTHPFLFSCADDADQEFDSQVVAVYPPLPVAALAVWPCDVQLNNENGTARLVVDGFPLLSDETDNDGWVSYLGDEYSHRVMAPLGATSFWVTMAGGYMSGTRDVVLSASPAPVVRYTTDNSTVTEDSPAVTGTVWLTDAATVRARAYVGPDYASDYQSDEAVAAFTAAIPEFTLPTTSQTSPLCVEGWRQDGTSKNVTVTVNGGTGQAVTFVGDVDVGDVDVDARLWFYNATLSDTAAVTIAVKDNGTTIKSESVTWTATDLRGASGDLYIRQGDSLLLTASPPGATLTIESDGDGLFDDFTGSPNDRFAATYNTAGTYAIAAKIDGTEVGGVTLHVVTIDTASPIGVRTGDDRTKDLTVTPSSAASQVVIQAPEPGRAQLVSQTTTGSGVQVVLHADGTGTAGIAARLGGGSGPILRAYGTHSFTITLVKPNLLCIVLWYENGDVLVPAALQMTPHYSGHQLQLHSLSGGLFEDSSGTTFWAPTGNFDAHGQYTYYMISTSPPTVCHKLGGVQE